MESLARFYVVCRMMFRSIKFRGIVLSRGSVSLCVSVACLPYE